MPHNDKSIHHRMRMMNPGDEFIVPIKDFTKVRAAAHYIKKDWDIIVRYHVFTDKDCARKVRVWLPDDAEAKRLSEMHMASFSKCRASMTRTLTQLKKLCDEYAENISNWLPSGLEYIQHNEEEERD